MTFTKHSNVRSFPHLRTFLSSIRSTSWKDLAYFRRSSFSGRLLVTYSLHFTKHFPPLPLHTINRSFFPFVPPGRLRSPSSIASILLACRAFVHCPSSLLGIPPPFRDSRTVNRHGFFLFPSLPRTPSPTKNSFSNFAPCALSPDLQLFFSSRTSGLTFQPNDPYLICPPFSRPQYSKLFSAPIKYQPRIVLLSAPSPPTSCSSFRY